MWDDIVNLIYLIYMDNFTKTLENNINILNETLESVKNNKNKNNNDWILKYCANSNQIITNFGIVDDKNTNQINDNKIYKLILDKIICLIGRDVSPYLVAGIRYSSVNFPFICSDSHNKMCCYIVLPKFSDGVVDVFEYYYSMIHEIVHSLSFNPNRPSNYFEEGVCEIVARYIIKDNVLGLIDMYSNSEIDELINYKINSEEDYTNAVNLVYELYGELTINKSIFEFIKEIRNKEPDFGKLNSEILREYTKNEELISKLLREF